MKCRKKRYGENLVSSSSQMHFMRCINKNLTCKQIYLPQTNAKQSGHLSLYMLGVLNLDVASKRSSDCKTKTLHICIYVLCSQDKHTQTYVQL